MGPTRVNFLITRVREDTGNLDGSTVNTNYGIADREIIGFLNDAVAELQARILEESPQGAFREEKQLDIVANQEGYTLPSDCLHESAVVAVYYSDTGNSDDYFELDYATESERSTQFTGTPDRYIRHDNTILLNPIPQAAITNGLKIKYIKQMPRMNVRTAQITTFVSNSSNRTLTSLTLNQTSALEGLTSYYDYLNVVDFYGNITMKNIPIDSINTSTGVVTVLTGFVYEVGESISSSSPNNYVVFGHYATSHSPFPSTCDRFLISRAKQAIYERDSHENSVLESQRGNTYLDDIMQNWASMDEDVIRIPELD